MNSGELEDHLKRSARTIHERAFEYLFHMNPYARLAAGLEPIPVALTDRLDRIEKRMKRMRKFITLEQRKRYLAKRGVEFKS